MHIEVTSVCLYCQSDFYNKRKGFTVFKRLEIFRRLLNAEMKDGTRTGVALQAKREEKEDVSDKDEQLFSLFLVS